MNYTIKPRLKKTFWGQPYIVYDIFLNFKKWVDPSYGNGGGEWVDIEDKVSTVKTEEQAKCLVEALNKVIL